MTTTCVLRITKVTDIQVEVPTLPIFDNARSLARLLGEGVFGHPSGGDFSAALSRLIQLINLATIEQAEYVRAQAPVGYDGELSVHGGVCMHLEFLIEAMRCWEAGDLSKRIAARARN